jgi:hypothetical protein
MADIIDIAKVREARASGGAAAKPPETLCRETGPLVPGAEPDERRWQLIAALLRALGPGWEVRFVG